ncbi:MAG: preprotein translocase subunit SecG [Endomicrobium sp.]|nr:preprotein translocase subunit SecG [Endomicrobium sp.]
MKIIFFKCIHYSICILLICLVLLQAGDEAGLSNIFGSGSKQIFNIPSGTLFIKKMTAAISCIFILNTLFLVKIF